MKLSCSLISLLSVANYLPSTAFTRSGSVQLKTNQHVLKVSTKSATFFGQGAFLPGNEIPQRHREPLSAQLDESSVQLVTSLLSEATYSRASYYTTLGLYLLSFPGLWSILKRATVTKAIQKTYEVNGPAAANEPKAVSQTAAEVMAYFKSNNYAVADAGEVITFKGTLAASKSQAFFLSFVTLLSMASLALVLQIQFPDIGYYWYALCLLSPYAGIYYWQNASREDEVKVKIEIADDEKTTDVIVQGGKEEIERFEKMVGYNQKGMVRVKGLFE